MSIAHKTRTEYQVYFQARSLESIPKPRIFKVWEDGSMACFPGIPHQDPLIKPNTGNTGGRRGTIISFSDASRRNLMRFIAKMRRDAEGYTMALTLPGDFESLPAVTVHECFKILCNHFTASGLFPGVSFIWKRELQQRGALRYHLLVFGVGDETLRRAFHVWMATQWNDLVCVHVTDEGKAAHLRWHLHERNLEKVRGNISGYFAKYLGKDEGTGERYIPGRWWGKVNGKALPVTEGVERQAGKRETVIAHRIARKLRQKRADEAKHRGISQALGMTGFDRFSPLFSQFQFLRMKQGHSIFSDMLPRFEKLAKSKGLRWGKAKSTGAAKYAGIHLISGNSPEIAVRIIEYAGIRAHADALLKLLEDKNAADGGGTPEQKTTKAPVRASSPSTSISP